MSIPTTVMIEHKCGHEEPRDLSDTPAGQRAGKAQWWSERPCLECFKRSGKRKVSKEVQGEREALRQAATEDQKRSNLPILSGSEKQVQWALTARYALLCDAYVDLVQEGELDEAGFEDKVLEPARQISPAKWWIDNRDATSSMVIELLADPGIEPERTKNENPF